MELKLYIRQTKLFNAQQQEIYIDGGNPQSLQVITGQLPQPRQWNIYNNIQVGYNNYIDVTDNVSDLFKLRLTFTQQINDLGIVTPELDNQKKAVSGYLTFEGDAYVMLKRWLIDDVSAPLNKVDVQIVHENCGTYDDWSITSKDLIWCEGEECQFDIALKQRDAAMTCIKNTMITDNWQGWFPEAGKVPAGGKKFPRFSYCNEARPNAWLVVVWWLLILNMPIFFVLGAVIATIWNSILFVFVAILSVVKFIINIVGGDASKIQQSIDNLKNQTIDLKDLKTIIGSLFTESSGCGREHPAPLIRDYIQNVCDKCGITVNKDTADIFFAKQITIQTSADKEDGQPATQRFNPHYNACYLGAVAQKGIRRIDNLSLTQGAVNNTTDFWLPQNAPQLTLLGFLDQLKPLYNANWRIINNTLYFQRKDYWQNTSFTFDFSKSAPDRNLLIQGLCFEWDEVKDAASVEGLYSLDAADTPGNDATTFMNSLISYGNTLLNPNMEGIQSKTVPFGATKFRLDGAATDYLLDAFQQLSNSSFTTGVVWAGATVRDIDNYLSEFADYALQIKQETTTLPKVIIWDGQSYLNAKAYRPFTAGKLGQGKQPPTPNNRYNNFPAVQQWNQRYFVDTSVLGSTNPSTFSFTVTNRTGLASTIVKDAWLVNYPMYFAPEFKDSMWDWFHWIDDPNNNPVLHQNFTAKLELCCDTLKIINPFNDASNIILGQKVKVDKGFYGEGYLNEIEIVYDPEDVLGQHIILKGRI